VWKTHCSDITYIFISGNKAIDLILRLRNGADAIKHSRKTGNCIRVVNLIIDVKVLPKQQNREQEVVESPLCEPNHQRGV
jgi:hypothetical protein